MIFEDRKAAGRRLAEHLSMYAGKSDVIVLGIPRGGVSVAVVIADELHAPLDIFLSRKLSVPGHEELAFGALAADDGRFLDQSTIQSTGITTEQIEQITDATRKILKERALLYRKGRRPLKLKGKTIILVDDGIATGSSIYAAIQALWQTQMKKLVVAVPVAPRSTCAWLQKEVDMLVVVRAPEEFHAVGQFYANFAQTTDQEVVDLLERSLRPHKQEAMQMTG
jgi:putative phosphoribosyl transferase